MMSKSDLEMEIEGALFDMEQCTEFLRTTTDSEARKEVHAILEAHKEHYIHLRSMLERGEYDKDADRRAIQQWKDEEENARVRGAIASCCGSY